MSSRTELARARRSARYDPDRHRRRYHRRRHRPRGRTQRRASLLVEARDFASGTSSWSSKLVHGGLRYPKNGQWRLTLESVRERQRS